MPLLPAHRARRGSLLIVAMLLSAVIAIALGSYISLSTNSLKLANRTFYNNAAMNLAETGIEETLWSFNQATSGVALSTAWYGWDTSDGVTAKRIFKNFDFGANTTGYVKVYLNNYNPASGVQPIAVAKTTIVLPGNVAPVEKYIEVQLRRRSMFAMGLVAKRQLTFNGNRASVDSWNSDPDKNSATASIPYSIAVANDHGSVGSTSVAVGSVAVNNADIWGFASVGSSGTSGLSVGTNGTVAAFGNPPGTIDSTRVATDFTANFEDVTNPTTGIALGAVGATLGSAGVTATYRYAGTINSSLTVFGNTTLILTAAAGTQAINLTGLDMLTIAPGATLTIYTAGDIKVAGNGILNTNTQPISLQIYGTSTSAVPQDIDIVGNGDLEAVVYAPNGDLTIRGNGNVMGSMVGNNITVVGDAAFHYDESLADFGANNPYGIVKWRELTTATDRSAYTSQLDF